MNVNMERASFTSLLENSQFGGPMQVPQLHTQAPPAFGLQAMTSQPVANVPYMKQMQQHTPAPAPLKMPADQSVGS
jgi:hypothetical protein